MFRFIISFIFLTMALTLSAQNLKPHFKTIKKGKISVLDNTAVLSLSKDKSSIVTLKEYLYSEDPRTETEALTLLGRIGKIAEDEKMRKEVVNISLDKALISKATITAKIASILKKFKQEDFDDASKEKIHQMIKEKKPHFRKFLMLAGFLEMSKELEALRTVYKKGSPEKQSLNLARVRAGNTERLESLMKNVPKVPINDDFIYDIAPLLIYVRQKESIDYIMDIILKGRMCAPADAESAGSIECGYRLMEMIAPVIKDFPFQYDETTGEIISDDYKQTLKDVKEWIEVNKGKYKLITNTY